MTLLRTVPALAITFVSSIIALGSAADLCDRLGSDCSGKPAYAVAVGVFSTLLTMVMLPLVFVERVNEWVAFTVGLFLTVWWCFGVGFATSVNGVFSVVGNGFFSSWICLFGSFFFTAEALVCARDVELRGVGVLSVILIASIVEFACAADICNSQDIPCTKQYGFAVAVGVISAVIAAVMLIFHHTRHGELHGERADTIVAVLLFIWWCFGAGFNTSYVGPFNLTNACTTGAGTNGYFATWVAFFGSLYYAVHSIPMVAKAFRRVLRPEAADTVTPVEPMDSSTAPGAFNNNGTQQYGVDTTGLPPSASQYSQASKPAADQTVV